MVTMIVRRSNTPWTDLLVAFFAGNYSDRTLFRYQEEFFPEYILPAVQEDDRAGRAPGTSRARM